MTTRRLPAKFRVSAQVVAQLGDELITDSAQALLELVKNSYDADADRVEVDIATQSEYVRSGKGPPRSAADWSATGRGGKVARYVGRLQVADNGWGMDDAAVRAGWLTLSDSPKRAGKRRGDKTPGGRTPLGDKGLGRLGAQRIGDLVVIRTRPRSDGGRGPKVEHEVTFDFADFAGAKLLDKVPVDWRKSSPPDQTREWPPQSKYGTVLEVYGLAHPDDWTDTARLVRELSRIVNPFKGVSGFSLKVRVDGERIDVGRVGRDVRAGAETTWRANFDGRRLKIEGDVRRVWFRTNSRRRREVLDREFEENNGRGLQQALLRTGGADRWTRTKGKRPWFVHLRRTIPLSEIGKNDPEGRPTEWADCGPFSVELDGVSLTLDELGRRALSTFDSQADYRDWIRESAGVNIYRDGFVVASGEDPLGLAEEFSRGTSYYGMRPANVLGYIAISAAGNPNLEETTDREGFRDTPAFRTFEELLIVVRDHINDALNFCGRTASDYIGERLKEQEGIGGATTSELLDRVAEAGRGAAELQRRLTASRAAVKTHQKQAGGSLPAQTKRALAEIDTELAVAEKLLRDVQDLEDVIQAIKFDYEQLEEQLEQTYETVGLGLVAESLTHEITHVVSRLSGQAEVARDASRAQDPTGVEGFIDEVDYAVRALRGQLRHLDPQLRYARTRRDAITLGDFVRDAMSFHRERLASEGIEVRVRVTGRPTQVRVVPGRLMQVLDNLALNSEYWIRHAGGRGDERQISVAVTGARVRFSDTGSGVSPDLENDIFEPFVSAKAGGRGLGLYISRQLLEREGGTLNLASQRAPDGRRRTFVVDLSDAIVSTTNGK